MKMKIISLLLVLILIFSNISYAVVIENETFQDSVMAVFPMEVTINLNDNGDESTITTSIPDSVVVNDKTITVTTDEIPVEINYVIEENKITFNMENLLFTEDSATEEESAVLGALVYFILYEEYIYKGIISVADALNLDIDTVISYFHQEIGKQESVEEEDAATGYTKSTVTTDLIEYEVSYNFDVGVVKANYVIDLERMSQIDETALTGNISATVSMSDVPTTGDNESENTETGSGNNESDNLDDSNDFVVSNEINNNTVAQSEMPKTGIKYETVYILLAVIVLCFIVGHKVYKSK